MARNDAHRNLNTRIEPIDDGQLAGLIDQELRYSLGGSGNADSSDSELTQSWTNAMAYYFGKRRGDEVEGRSRVISMDLADMVEQTIAQIMPAFDTDNLGQFEAYDVAEEDQAQSESAAVNWTILNQNNGFIEFTNAIKDSLLQRNGIVKCYVDEHFEVVDETYENVGLFAAQQLLNDPNTPPNVEIEVTGQETIQEGQFGPAGEILQEPIFNLEIRKTIQVKQLKVESVPPEEFCVNGDHGSIYLDDARFVCHTRYPTRSDLIKMGYDPDIVNDLPSIESITEIEQRARSRDEQENEKDTAQRQSDRIEVKECYYQVDMDGDGIAERRKILRAGKTILENEVFPIVPFAAGTCFLLPHRFWALSMYDKLKQTQDVKTAFLRKTIDNAEGLINQRVIVNPNQVEMDDVLSSRPTGVVRAKRPDAVVPFPVQNMGDTGFRMLGYMDKVRKEAGGAQLDMGTQENMPVQGQTAHGMERWMSSQEQLSGLMVKTQAKTLIQSTYLIAHQLLRMFFTEQITYKSQGRMVSAIPGSWPARPRVSVNIQVSMAEKQRIYGVLEAILEKQNGLKEQGKDGVMTSDTQQFNALMDQAKIAGIDNPDRYWINPASEPAQKAAQQNAQSAQQAKQAQTAQEDKLLITQIKISEMQESSDKMKAQMDYLIKSNEQLRKWIEMDLENQEEIPTKAPTLSRIS